jgi:hypothetical protein
MGLFAFCMTNKFFLEILEQNAEESEGKKSLESLFRQSKSKKNEKKKFVLTMTQYCQHL